MDTNRIIHQQPIQYVQTFHQQGSNNPHVQSIAHIQLTVERYASNTWNLSYLDNLKPCLLAVQFTYLKINCYEISADLLIEVIRLLSNLQSLRLSSMPLVEVCSLSAETTEMLVLVSITNKITRVKLDKMAEIQQIHFLMSLCPRMQYLELGCTTQHDLESILRTISTYNVTHAPYLHCLCLCVLNGNEKMIQGLHTIIDFERLLHSENVFHKYTIRRICDRIFVKWQL